MTSQTHKNAHHTPPVNNNYEKVRLWMTDDEIKYFLVKENRFGILLSLILLRYKAIRRYIASLAEVADAEWKEHLLRMDEDMQVYHFFCQSLMDQFSDDQMRYLKIMESMVKKLK